MHMYVCVRVYIYIYIYIYTYKHIIIKRRLTTGAGSRRGNNQAKKLIDTVDFRNIIVFFWAETLAH